MAWLNNRVWLKIKKLVLIMIVFGMICYFYIILTALRCNTQAERTLQMTPSGDLLPFFDASIKFKTFGELSQTCNYIDDKIVCPDVRQFGETIFRQSQLAMSRLLKILELICKRHKIPYWIHWGTLLGAVRHKGYIPWDVDTDVGILIDDVDIFIKAASKDLPQDIFLQTSETDSGFAKYAYKGWMKIRDLNSCYGNNIKSNLNFQDGLQVDIFFFKNEDIDDIKYLYEPYVHMRYLYNDIFPLKTISYEGFTVSCPQNAENLLIKLYGTNFMTYPKVQCPIKENGYIPIPWYSCKYIENLAEKERRNLFKKFLIPYRSISYSVLSNHSNSNGVKKQKNENLI